MFKETLILDCDGVTLQWESNLPFFALEHGLNVENVLKAFGATEHISPMELFGVPTPELGMEMIALYNEGKFGRYLAPYADAVAGIKTLSKKFNLITLSSYGSNTTAWLNRQKNLQAFFPDCFSEVITIPLGESKVPYVRAIQDRLQVVAFVDDQLKIVNDVKNNCDILSIQLNRNVPGARCHSIDELDGLIQIYKGKAIR